jgi:hypothetical protein
MYRIPRSAPTGVKVIALLTLFSSVALGFLSFILWFLNFAGFAFASSVQSLSITARNVYAIFPPIFALFSLVASILLLISVRWKYLWHSLLGYWLVLIVYFLFLEAGVFTNYVSVFSQFLFGMGVNWDQFGGLYSFLGRGVVYLIPFIYSFGCIAYFLKETPRKYFSIQ